MSDGARNYETVVEDFFKSCEEVNATAIESEMAPADGVGVVDAGPPNLEAIGAACRQASIERQANPNEVVQRRRELIRQVPLRVADRLINFAGRQFGLQ